VKKALNVNGLMFVIAGFVLSMSYLAAGNETSPVAESLKRDFPKLEFQSVQPTKVDGVYEVVAGMNVLYYNPKNGVILFGEMFSKDWKNQTAEKRSMLTAGIFKEIQLDQAGIKSGIDGLYEVVSGQNVIYYDPKSGTKLIGEMYTKEGKNLTVEARDKASAQAALKELPLDKAIKIGKGKNTVIMFTDPDCPFCRKIEEYFKDRKDIIRYVYLLPLEQLHPKSMDKSKIIMCSPDKMKAFFKAMGGSLDTEELKPCADEKVAAILNDNISLARRLGIQGTPYLIVNGVAVRGADTKRIDELLSDNGKK
jgi:thiol:disulfide interchange protein DsbC